MKNLYILIIFILAFADIIAQKEAYNWDFGGRHVITFNTQDGEPRFLMQSFMNNDQGSSAISDSTGKFLFSSEGIFAYSYIDFPYRIQYNGDSISSMCSHQRSNFFGKTQSGLIVKQPGSDCRYYVFSSRCFDNSGLIVGSRYSIVDMCKNNGKGEMLTLNQELTSPTNEKLIGIKHANDKDVWIITHKSNSREFNAHLLTEIGIAPTPIKSTTGVFHPNGDELGYIGTSSTGYMKSNLKGDLIALVILETGAVDILKFDKMSGKVTSLINFNLLDIDTIFKVGASNQVKIPYGVEFSPDSKKLFVSITGMDGYLIQFDISKLDLNYLRTNYKIISSNPYIHHNALQIAPNGKIYLLTYGDGSYENKLYVINYPNLTGDSVKFEKTNLSYVWNTNPINPYPQIGLPNFVQGLFDFVVKISANKECEGDELVLTAQANPDITVNKYTWLLPDGSQRTGKTIKIPNAKLTDAGLYKVTVDINSTIRTDSVKIEIYPKPIAKISGNLSFCKNGSTTLSANNGNNYKYKWSSGETSQNITVKNEGRYILTVENGNGCKSYDTVNVIYSSDLEFDMVAQTKLCTGDTLLISTNLIGSGYNFDWSNGEKTPQILITKGGKYVLKVKSDAGCEGIDSVIIEEFEKPEVNFEKSNYTICQGESVVIKPTKINSEYEYIWSDGILGAERIFTESADLYLIAKLNSGCNDTAFVKIEVLEVPEAKISASQTEVCFGNKITLTAENFNPKFKYLWSNNQSGKSISVMESGTYKLIASNGNLCADTAEISVIIHPTLDLQLIADKTNLCFDDTTTISTKQKYAEYLWSTGETTPNITVKDAGIYQLIVKNDFGCADTAEITITKYNAKISTDINQLIFNELCVGETLTKTIKITLTEGEEFVISEVSSNSSNFGIKLDKNIVKSGEIAEITITFNPKDAGNFDDELVIKSTFPCSFERIIPMTASSKKILKFTLPDISTEPGKFIEIPVNAEIICPEPQKFSSDYEFEFAVNKEYFKPDSLKYGLIKSNQIIGNDRVITISANAEFQQNESEINLIYGQALIGREETVSTKILNAKFTNPKIQHETKDGSLRVDGCINNISGLQMFKPTTMKITPNPSDSEIKVQLSSQSTGAFSIIIYDMQGREVARESFVKTNQNYETRDYLFNINNLGAGIYSVHLNAPWSFLREQVVIIK
jgi:hypothetical protein